MKPLLYIGAALMIGAGIYGFVDYKKKGHSKAFQSLYKEEQKNEVQETVTEKVAPAAIPASMGTEKKDTVAAGNKSAGRKQVVKKQHKKLNRKQFSRAALVEKVEFVEDVEEVPLPEPEKKAGQ